MANPAAQQPWIPLAKIEELVQVEPALLILGMCIGAFLAYKILLGEISTERHRNIRTLFRNLLAHVVICASLFATYEVLHQFGDAAQPATTRLLAYLGFLAMLSGTTVTVKVARILAFEYLFLSHMKVAVPLLLVNLFSLLLSVVLGGWIVTEVFSVRLAPLLATSAIFSLILGLALQDTLGNLFAGVALQFDKPYEIGDWVEVQNGGQKWVGQIEEISWRATVLIGFADELITIPNRIMGQSQIANYTRKGKPIVRSQVIRISYDTDQEKARAVMMEALKKCERIRKDIDPIVFALEASESWVTFKLAYFIDNYGSQYSIGDEVIKVALEHLKRAGIPVAAPRLQLQAADGGRAPCNPTPLI